MDEATVTRKRIKSMGFVMGGTVPYQVQCYPPRHSLLTEGAETFTDRLSRVVVSNNGNKQEKTRIDRVFLPDVQAMSGRRARFSEFKKTGVLHDGKVEVYTAEAPSDVVAIRRRQGVFFRAGGCLLVVATGGGYCVAGHAGRDSLVCPVGTTRAHESVVHAIAESFDRKGIARSNIMIRTFFGIQPEAFVHDPAHPERGEYNQALLEHVQEIEDRVSRKAHRLGIKQWSSRDTIIRIRDKVPHLSLYHLLKAQAILLEIYNIGNEKPLPIDGDFAYTRHRDPEFVNERNWVFAFRE
jgi:hypothetical protein